MEKVRDHGRDHNQEWRELCAVATREADPVRLASLVRQILQVFDEHEQDGERALSSLDEGRSQSALRPPTTS